MKNQTHQLALLVRDKNPDSPNFGREGYAVGVANQAGKTLIEIETRHSKAKPSERFFSNPDDVQCISPSHILRAVRQEKRAGQAKQFDKNLVSATVARLWVIFGGDIATYQNQEHRGEVRSTRMQRAIRAFQRKREEAKKLAKLRNQQAA